MAIQVIDRRKFNIVPQVSNIPSVKEVTQMKVNAIVVKQGSAFPMNQEVKAMKVNNPNKEVVMGYETKKHEVYITLAKAQEMIEVAVIKKMHELGIKPQRTQQEVKEKKWIAPSRIRVNAETANAVRIHNSFRPKSQEVEMPVEEVKVHADMHKAGKDAYLTRITKQLRKAALSIYNTTKVVKVILDENNKVTAKAATLRFKGIAKMKDGSRFANFEVETLKSGQQVSYTISYKLKQ